MHIWLSISFVCTCIHIPFFGMAFYLLPFWSAWYSTCYVLMYIMHRSRIRLRLESLFHELFYIMRTLQNFMMTLCRTCSMISLEDIVLFPLYWALQLKGNWLAASSPSLLVNCVSLISNPSQITNWIETADVSFCPDSWSDWKLTGKETFCKFCCSFELKNFCPYILRGGVFNNNLNWF